MKERIIIIGLILVIISSLYSELVYKPFREKNKKSSLEIKKLEGRIEDIRTKYPSLAKREQSLASLEKETELLEKEIKALEEKLPSQARSSVFLGELTRQAEGLKMNISSVRQKIESGSGLSRLLAEIRLRSFYQDIINYLYRLEKLSPYLSIEEMEIAEPAKGKEEGTDLSFLISIPLSDRVAAEALPMVEGQERVEVGRDIFISKEKSGREESRLDMKLEGITFRGKNSTAIINGQVVRIGSWVRGYQVKEILAEAVIISNERQEHRLSLSP